MDKRLLEQVQQALQAQQDTIIRQEKMLDGQQRYMEQQLRKKDQDIAELTASLNKLAQTKTQEMQRLPMLFNTLKESMEKYTKEWVIWKNHRKEHVETQERITEQLLVLANTQNRLVEMLKQYQSTITPPDYLESDTTQLENGTVKLESKLNKLANVQSEIEQSQTEITAVQEKLRIELKILDKSTSKLEP